MTTSAEHPGAAEELRRIKRDYEARDGRPPSPLSGFAAPGYHFYIQQLEWALLTELRRARVSVVGADVLEVGCGAGYFLDRFLQFGAGSAVGIDLVARRVEEARRRHPQLDVRVGNAADLPWEDESFDLVTQFTCLSSVQDPRLRETILGEMWRVLRPGGAIVSFDLRGMPMPLRLAGRLRRRWQRGSVAATTVSPVTLRELRQAFPEAAELRDRSLGIPLEISRVAAWSRPAATALAALPPLRTHWLVIARRRAN